MANTSEIYNLSFAKRSNQRQVPSYPYAQAYFNVVHTPTTNYWFPQEQVLTMHNSSPHSTILISVIPVIINLIQLKCESKGNSPFDTNPITMWLSISCLLAYCLAYGIELKFASADFRPPITNSQTLIRSASYLSGSLCLASLASTFFPNKMKPIFYAFYALLSTGDLLYKYTPIGKLWTWIFQKFEKNSSNLSHQADSLPV